MFIHHRYNAGVSLYVVIEIIAYLMRNVQLVQSERILIVLGFLLSKVVSHLHSCEIFLLLYYIGVLIRVHYFLVISSAMLRV